MEDINIGRRTATVIRYLLSTGAAQILADEDRDRVMLIFFPPNTGTLFVSTDPNMTNSQGIRIPTAGPPVILRVETHGQLVMKRWFGFDATAAHDLTVAEGHLEKQ